MDIVKESSKSEISTFISTLLLYMKIYKIHFAEFKR